MNQEELMDGLDGEITFRLLISMALSEEGAGEAQILRAYAYAQWMGLSMPQINALTEDVIGEKGRKTAQEILSGVTDETLKQEILYEVINVCLSEDAYLYGEREKIEEISSCLSIDPSKIDVTEKKILARAERVRFTGNR